MLLTMLATLACGQATVPPAHWMPRGCRDRSCWTHVGGRGNGGGGSSVPVFQNQEVFNFGSAAAGPTPSRPTFAGDATLKYLFYVKSDCTVACVVDDLGTACPGLTWNTPTAPTCQQIWTGDWALTDITDTKAWVASGITFTTLFSGDISLSVFGYATSKESINAMMAFAYDTGANNAVYLRNESGTVKAAFWETTTFPTPAASITSYNGFAVTTSHRTGHARNVNINGGAESTDTTTALGAISAVSPMTVGLGANPLAAGQGMGGQLVWVAIYASGQTLTQSTAVVAKAMGIPSGILSPSLVGTTLCFDQVDAGQMPCLLNGLSYIDQRGIRVYAGERTASKWAADPLDVSSWTAVQSPGVVTNVKAGPLFELTHTNEMDRIIDLDAVHFSGYKSTASSFIRAPDPYTECVYLSVGDGGTSDKARLELTVTGGLFADGGTVVDCDFAGLTGTPQLKSCTATMSASYDGGVDIRGAVYVGNAAADTGSLTVGHARLNMGVACEPASLSNAAVGDGYILWDSSGWHTDSAGGAHEVVWSPLSTAGFTSSTNSPYSDWQESSSAVYLHDAYSVTDHLITFIHGYTIPGHILMRFASVTNSTSVDLTVDNVNLTVGSTYATTAKWLPTGGGNCALSMLEDTCNGSISSCVATTALATASGGCPDQPPNLKVGQRYDNTIPTDGWVLSVRHKTP